MLAVRQARILISVIDGHSPGEDSAALPPREDQEIGDERLCINGVGLVRSRHVLSLSATNPDTSWTGQRFIGACS